MKNRFFIIVTGWNCADKVKPCYFSLLSQTHENWRALFIDDGSSDPTAVRMMMMRDDRAATLRFEGNRGAAFRRHEAMSLADLNDIVLFLGMDDELLPNALERINQEYEQGKLMTYGNWINQDGNGLPAGFELDFPENVHLNRSYRQVKYRSTAPNTFRRFLYDCIKPEDLQYDGEWYRATTESEVMFSCLEQCGKDRIGVIKEPIYLYNQDRADNARSRFGSSYQEKIYNIVKNRPKRDLWSGS